MIHQRHRTVARTIIEAIESNNPTHTTQGVASSMESLRAVGFTIPSCFMGRVDPGRKPEQSLRRRKTPLSHGLVGSRRQQLQCTSLSWKESCAFF